MSLSLRIRTSQNIPSHKNKYRIGRKSLYQDKRVKELMDEIVSGIVCQCVSYCRTTGLGTTPECIKQFAIASLPLDDNWQVLEIGRAYSRRVSKGEEGVEIEVEEV